MILINPFLRISVEYFANKTKYSIVFHMIQKLETLSLRGTFRTQSNIWDGAFYKTVHSSKLLSISAKISILNIWLGFQYASESDWIKKIYLFHFGGLYHTETGLCMMGTSAVKEKEFVKSVKALSTHSAQCSISIPPWNISKYLVWWCFSGTKK